MPKVSVVIIAKNEEKKIALCLESVKWADDIVVVDGMSDDRTVEVAKSHGAKVISRQFTGSFADDRNEGMKHSTNDWVLQLDADDVVTGDFLRKMEEAFSGSSDVIVYKFRRKNFFLGHSMDHGGFHHYIPNLVNRKHVRFEGTVHEVPVYDGKIGVIEADIEHYPFDSIAQFVDRQNRYARIAARAIFDKSGILPQPAIRRELIGRTFKIFWKSYIKKQGYKEGMYGLVFAVLFSFINFLKWSHYWEMCEKEEK